MSSDEAIRFYFSLRSPYAWLAAERLDDELGDLPVPVEPIPVYPTPGLFPNDPISTPAKVAYMVQDVRRLTREQGLALRFPEQVDTDWALCHAACLGAQLQGDGRRFMLEIFRKRWAEGLDVGEDEVVADAARRADLEPDSILAAAHDESLRSRAEQGWKLGMERDGIFGVPSFAYAGKLYWGQDRMRFLHDAVLRKSSAST